MLQLTELVTPWSFWLAIHQISSHRCRGRPTALGVGRAPATRLPWQDSRRRPLETASHRGVALLRPEHH